MARQVIGVGTAANDGTGDTIRAAFQKVNADFAELYPDAAGDLIYGTAADTIAILGIGAANGFLRVNAGANAPEWRTQAQTISDLQGDGSSASSVGFRGIPLASKSADYTFVLADAGGGVFHPSSDANARAFTIPPNASVAYPVNTVLVVVNDSAISCTIPITSDTLVLAGTGSTGTRTVAQYGICTLLKIGTTRWYASGPGVT